MDRRKLLLGLVTVPLLFGCSLDFLSQSKDPVDHSEENPTPQGNQHNEEENQHDNNVDGNIDGNQNDNKNEGKIRLDAKYFNIIEVVNGLNVIQNTDNTLMLVNKQYSLPSDFTPSDLVIPNVKFSFGKMDIEKAYMRQVAATAMEKMFRAAEQDGVYLFAVSGYRSYARQDELFRAEVSRVGEEKAKEAVAYPGQSEHQTGLTMDISAESVNFLLTEEFENTKEGKWLADNAHKYGFILRYPKGKEAITGYKYEPWHFRYVGEEYATIIYENQLTLEEFFEQAESI